MYLTLVRSPFSSRSIAAFTALASLPVLLVTRRSALPPTR